MEINETENQRLISDCQAEIAELEKALTTWGDAWIPSIQSKLKRQKMALASLTAEPEYNISYEGGEVDLEVSKARYDACHPSYRWISYEAPPAQILRPVELPDISAGKYYTEEGAFMAFDYKRDLKAAIRAAGGEVKP